MARNVNVMISDIVPTGGTVPAAIYELTFEATWTANDGTPQTRTEVERFPHLVGWLITNHPQVAKRVLTDLCWQIARVKYGLDDAEDIG